MAQRIDYSDINRRFSDKLNAATALAERRLASGMDGDLVTRLLDAERSSATDTYARRCKRQRLRTERAGAPRA